MSALSLDRRTTGGVVAYGARTVRSARAARAARTAPVPVDDCDSCSMRYPNDEWNFSVRDETPAQRVDRNYSDILQELRIAQTGVQLLFASLLGVAFTSRFASFTEYQRSLFVVTLIVTAATAALLIAPAPYHRVVFRRRLKGHLVTAASRFAVAGLAMLALSFGCALLLVLDVVLGHATAVPLAGVMALWFGGLWFAVPLRQRARHRHLTPVRPAPAT